MYALHTIVSPSTLFAFLSFSCQVKSFKDYVELYLKGQEGVDEEEEMPRKVVHEVAGPRWEVCVTASNAGFKQASFVNSIATTKVREREREREGERERKIGSCLA